MPARSHSPGDPATQSSIRQNSSRPRNRSIDLLRIIFATLVLLAHAPELTPGRSSDELFQHFTHSKVSFGMLGVDGFFLLSGFLIVQSWVRNPALLVFLQKRLLRIVPGYLVAALLSTLVVGLLAPAIPGFFQHFTWDFPLSLLLLDDPRTPPVLPVLVNGSMWTIPYEFRCYLLVALLGVLGLFRRPVLWLALTLFLIPTMSYRVWHLLVWRRFVLLTGEPPHVFRLTATFCIGGCFYLFRKHITFRPAFALVAAVLLGVFLFLPTRPSPL